jgi:hypothetical protein
VGLHSVLCRRADPRSPDERSPSIANAFHKITRESRNGFDFSDHAEADSATHGDTSSEADIAA